MFVSVDIETTGFDPKENKIIEIAACRFDENKIYETWKSLVQPAPFAILSDTIVALTGITTDELRKAPLIEEVLPQLEKFARKDPIVGHNIPFDVSFLKHAGLSFENPLYDTCELSRVLSPRESSYALEILAHTWKLEHQPTHRAYDDILATAELFQRLLRIIRDIPAPLRKEISRISERSSWPYKTFFVS